MVIKYTFEFTDTSKIPPSFDVFPYTANGTVSPTDLTLIDQAVNANTTLKLYGKGMPDYGEGIEQNLIYMLENFANDTAPPNPIEGQMWYNNVGFGVLINEPELLIHNPASSAGVLLGWDAVILATGTSQMTGELVLAGNPTNVLGATPKQYVDAHINDAAVHMTVDQNIFLDGLTLTGSPALTFADVNQLIGISGNVQSQLDGKLSLNGLLPMTGELTLSGNPITVLGATTKQYVDGLVFSGANDSALGLVDWIIPTGSPLPIVDINATTLQFTITTQGSPPVAVGVLTAEGVSKVGHVHPAADITVNNTSIPAYSNNVQSVIEELVGQKAELSGATFYGPVNMTDLNVTGTGTFINPVSGSEPINSADLTTKNYVDNKTNTMSRTFVALATDLTSGTPYKVQIHSVDDNKLSITINGIKQYVHAAGMQQIQYDPNIPILQPTALTGIDQTLTYEFDISVDGNPVETITILPSIGSPAGLNTTTHGDLISVINSIMSSGSPPLVNATFSINGDFIEQFASNSTGTSSSIIISDPGGANVYLFGADAGTAITAVNFIFYIAGNPDEITMAGDQTAFYPAARAFSIRGSDELTYGGYDGAYRVHNNGPIFAAGVTTIPIATLADSSIPQSLIPAYPGGSPAPVISPFGSAYVTPIVGFDSVLTAINGINGDYAETDLLGNQLTPGTSTDYVVFNYDILVGGSPIIPNHIETLLIS